MGNARSLVSTHKMEVSQKYILKNSDWINFHQSMLSFEVTPGKSLGQFYIGMPISEAIHILQKQFYKTARLVEIIYDQNDPLSLPILLNMTDHNISLSFDSQSQRLKLVHVYDLSRVKLSYGNAIFSGKKDNTHFVNVYQTFGPTYPGKFNKKGEYLLSYPGLSFVFPIPSKFRSHYENPQNSQEMPIELPDRTTPTATELILFRGHDLDHPQLPNLKDEKNYYFQQVLVSLGLGITFVDHKRTVSMKMSPQDVMSELGAPDSIFYKSHDKLKIHSTKSDHESSHEDQPTAIDYFYNYFSLGIDIMFSGATHGVEKIILRTNFPGSKDFNVYKKCNYQISIKEKNVTPNDKFEVIQKLLGEGAKPLVHTSPFGKTWYYAYENCIFEVLQNGYVNSVQIFDK